MSFPPDPIAAVTHADPYPYYAQLPDLAFHDGPGLWVATRDAARAALVSDRCAVRPADEPVPLALVGTAAGALFARLVRMRDGQAHRGLKRSVTARLEALELARVAAVAAEHGRDLAGAALDSPGGVTGFALELPVVAMASLVGVERGALRAVAREVAAFAACIAPGAAPDTVSAGIAAAAALRARFGADDADDDRAANTVGFLVQSLDATAGLIGNAVVALGRRPELADLDAGALIDLALATDPSVHNTRRFVIEAGDVAGQPMRAGERILVILVGLSFGAGAHACPGAAIARAIAAAGVDALREAGLDPSRAIRDLRYRPSRNARVPVLGDRS